MTAAITGLGAIASIGGNVGELFDNLCAGRSGLAPMRGFDHAKYNARQLFEVDNRPAEGVDVPKRATALLGTAIREALADAGLGPDLDGNPVLIGTGLRELRSVELWWRDGAPFEAGDLHFGSELRREFGAADTHTFAGACSASLYALALGADLIAAGEHDTVVVAGVDVVTESMFGLSDRFQPVPPDRVRPLDVHRKGTILGEGAGAIVLRAPENPGRARLRSVGINCDAYHATAPDPAGVSASIRSAHERAGIKPSDVDLVLLHGTGTPLNDEVEAGAVREVFGEALETPLLTGIKSMTGHTSGSAGALSLVTAVRSLETGLVPPITGVAERIEETEGMRVVLGTAQQENPTVAQVHGFGFGGVNAVAMLEVS
ncbi:beta-ketoacyl synthase N-terminal-like domain-containing protein [Sciscionella marina]|uniref:beta-ketoacyl synthase N-terminal-like domain-containing protein n=1 Tax=Sciscionella marina TaxID=508770 RepID=UPI000373FB84|nr:beta-ketoacyl synthase N-terminal-like domain-containing protein [Sciscionella marina]